MLPPSEPAEEPTATAAGGEDYGDPDYVQWAREQFTLGGCLEFAAVLHERRGWRIRASVSVADGTLGHAWAVRPDGRAVDALGLREGEDAHTYPPREPETAIYLDLAEAERRFGLDPENLAWARDLLSARPEITDQAFDWEGSRYAGGSTAGPGAAGP